jgi:hypothetical protein
MATDGRGGRGQLRADFCDASPQKAALVVCVRELEGAFVFGARLVCTVEAAEQVGSGGVVVLIGVQVEAVDEGEAGFGSFRLGDGDRAVQLRDRRAGDPDELRVEAAICGQSCGSSMCSDAIAAWTTYGPPPWSARARSSASRPSFRLETAQDLVELVVSGAREIRIGRPNWRKRLFLSAL